MVCEEKGQLVIVLGRKTVVINNALYIPKSATLISISQLTNDLGMVICFDKEGMTLYPHKEAKSPLFKVRKGPSEKLWKLPLKNFEIEKGKKGFAKAKAFFAKFDKELDPDFIHKRYNHISLPYLKAMFPQFSNVQKLKNCDACNAMAPRASYRKTFHKVKDEKVLSLRESNLEQTVEDKVEEKVLSASKNDPNVKKEYGRYFSSDTKVATATSVRGYSYIFVVIDHDTKVVESFLGMVKSDFEREVSFFLRNFYNVHKRFPAFWKFDSGGENLNHEIRNLFESMGIKFEYTTTGAHNSNAHVERTVEAIWTYARKILLDAGMPMVFWCYAATYAVFVMNHMPNRSLNMDSPLKRAGMKQHYDKIRRYGTEVWFTDEGATGKDARKRRGVFLGISDLKMGYDVLDIENKCVIQTRNVTWNEECCPFLDVRPPMLLELDIGTWPKCTPTYTATSPLWRSYESEKEGGDIHLPASPQVLPIAVSTHQTPSPQIDTHQTPPTVGNQPPPAEKFDDPNATIPLIGNQPLSTEPEEKFEQEFTNLEAGQDNIPVEESEEMKESTTFPETDVDATEIVPGRNDGYYEDLDGNDTTILIPPHTNDSNGDLTPGTPKEIIVSENIISPIFENRPPTTFLHEVSWDNDWKTSKRPTSTPDFSMFPSNDPINFESQKPLTNKKFFHNLGKKGNNLEKKKRGRPRKEGRYVELYKDHSKVKTFTDEGLEPIIEWGADEKFVATEITGERNVKGVHEYLVSWADTHRGTRYWDPTWEPAENLIGCGELINKFEKSKLKTTTNPIKMPKVTKSAKVPREGTRKSERIKNAKPSQVYYSNSDSVDEDFEKVYYSGTIPAEDEIPPDELLPESDEKSRPTGPEEFPPPPSYEEHHHFVPDNISLEEVIQQAYHSIEEILKSIDEETLSAPKTRSKMLNMEEAIRDEFIKGEWRELAGIRRHGTYVLMVCPKGRKPITCRWVYDIKRDAEGKITLFKARLVVHGYKQVEGIDFQKTFSSTIQMRTFRLIVAIAVNMGLKLTQYDISNAFLNGKLEEDVYMETPPGYEDPDGKIWKLLKGLYGLKQASRIWQSTLYSKLKKAGMTVCKTESGILYIRCDKTGDLLILACWVDDLIIGAKNETLRKKIEAILEKYFITKILGPLSLYVGVVVEQESVYDAFLHQKPYSGRVVKKYIGENFRPSKIPASSTERLSKVDSPVTEEEKSKIDYPYINATGSLLYLVVCTRPDMFYGTMQLAKFNSNPGEKHVKASKMMLRYLAGTLDDGLKFSKDPNFNGKFKIEAYVDSDWAGDPDTRRSTCGYIIHVNGCPVSWKSKTMKTIALSSCEAEFMALTEVCREIMWMCRFFDEIGLEYSIPEIYSDSSSALNWADDPIQHQRNKHVEIKYYYVRDMVAEGNVKAFKISSTNNVSDIMTKPVGKQILDKLKPGAMGYEKVVQE